MKTKVVVVDRHVSIREMLALVLAREGAYEIVGEAGTGFEALKVCRRLKPRLVVMDLALPELNGAQVLRSLREELRDTRFIVYSSTVHRDVVIEALQARPHGFVHKTDPLVTFCEALRAVAAGCCYLTAFAMKLLDESRGTATNGANLTDRERSIVQMIAEGLSNKEMAARCSIAPKTIEHHRAQVMQKLGLRDVAALTRFAVRSGLVPLES